MAISDQYTRAGTSSNHSTRSNNSWLIAYAAVALIAMAASVYLAAAGPGMNEAEITIAAALP